MSKDSLLEEARKFASEQWPVVRGNLDTLVAIDSSLDTGSATEHAPYGLGARKALDTALEMARSYGFETYDCEGRCGYAHVEGSSDKLLGIIGHLDVVAAGDGWTFDPFSVTEKDGYLIGRGVSDDKGPMLMAFHALRFWKQRYNSEGVPFPVGVRFLFGCSEETGMEDADYYIENYQVPDFLFTPDAEFPLCYGEKGHFQARVKSKPMVGGAIRKFSGGTATNGVPGYAEAIVSAVIEDACPPKGIEVCVEGGSSTVRSFGASGHAARPEGSENAVEKLARYLIGAEIGTADEREWLEFVVAAASGNDGRGLGVSCSDEDFGPLTCVVSVASKAEDRFCQEIDMRYPTTTCAKDLEEALRLKVAAIGASLEVIYAIEPLLVPADSPQVQALGAAYEKVTGVEASLFTMGGGTYAHHFPAAVSFGAVDENRYPAPAWVGGMHAADEGIAKECLQDALVIYILALGNLFELDWS